MKWASLLVAWISLCALLPAHASTSTTLHFNEGLNYFTFNGTRPCTADPLTGLVGEIQSGGSGFAALSTDNGRLLQAAGWTSGFAHALPSPGTCTNPAERPLVLVIASDAPGRAVLQPRGSYAPRKANASFRLQSFISGSGSVTSGSGSLALIPNRRSQPFTTTRPGQVLLWSFEEYAAHAASNPGVCVLREPGACPEEDRSAIVDPIASGVAVAASEVVDPGQWFSVFDDGATAGARLQKTFITAVLQSR